MCKLDQSIQSDMCKLPDFQPSKNGVGYSNQVDSVTSDNIELGAKMLLLNLPLAGKFTELNSILNNFEGHLTNRVVAMDVDFWYLKNHRADSGQRAHFMRAANGETVATAYYNGVEFIHIHAAKWVDITLRIKQNPRSVINNSLRAKALEHLAQALHCLQDTFSPYHVSRTPSSDPDKPGVIKDIGIYKEQDHSEHSRADYRTGSLSSKEGQSAVNASAELMLMCIRAVARQTYMLPGLKQFKEKWLAFNPN